MNRRISATVTGRIGDKMTVNELIDVLRRFPPDTEVRCMDQEDCEYSLPINHAAQKVETDTEYFYVGQGMSRYLYATVKSFRNVVVIGYKSPALAPEETAHMRKPGDKPGEYS